MFHAYPLLPVRDLVVFPGMTLPIYVGRSPSVAAIAQAEREKTPLVLIAQRRGATEHPGMDELYEFGTVATLLNRLTLDNGSIKAQLQATARARIVGVEERGDHRVARVEVLEEPEGALASARQRLEPAFMRLYPSAEPVTRPVMDTVVAAMQAVLEGDAASQADRLDRLRAALEAIAA